MQSQHSTISDISYKKNRKPGLSALLAEHGAGFVLIPGGEKAPRYKGWQKEPKTLAEALSWAKRGGNVGLLGGVGGLVIIDADDNADGLVAIEPRLAQTVRIFRTNAPERAKWIVHIDGELPPAKKNHEKAIEVLAERTQGVIFGRHTSGAPIRHDGDQVITLTAADVRRLWRVRTGEELGQTQRRDDAAPPDAEAVARSMALAETVLTLANVNHDGWQEYDAGGRKAVLHQCPFNPPDDPHAEDQAAVIVIGADGRIGATCHHARCQERIRQHADGGWSLLKEIAGYRPQPPAPVDLAHTRALVDKLREFVRRADLAEHVPIMKQSDAGYRTRDTDAAVADAVLDIAHAHGRLDCLVLSQRRLRALTGLGSPNTVGAALDRLGGWFVVKHDGERKEGEAQLYAIAPALVAWAEESCCVDRALSSGEIPDLLDQDNKRAIYATSPFVTHRAHDAFTASQTPITPEELQGRIDERQAEIDAGADVKPIERSRYRRRLEALLPSAGRGVLRMIDALATEGDTCTRRELRELLNVTSPTLSRLVARARQLGLVDADRNQVTLHEQWRDLADAFAPYMPTANRGIERAESDDNARIRWAERSLAQPGLSQSVERRHRRAIRMAAKRKAQRAAMLRPDLAHAHDDVAPPKLSLWSAPSERAARLRTHVAIDSRIAERKSSKSATMDEWRAAQFKDKRTDAELLWRRFSAYMDAHRGAGWWVQMSETDVLGAFSSYQMANEHTREWVTPDVLTDVERHYYEMAD